MKKIAEIRGSAFYGSIRFEYTDKGIPFIRVADIKDLTIDKNDLVYLPEDFRKYEKQIAKINAKWIVLSKSGATFGGIGIIPEDIKICMISRDVLGIKPKNGLLTGYLAAFLNSKYGQLQIKRSRSIQAQPHLEIKMVKEILIPLPSKVIQQDIAILLESAISKRREAHQRFAQAEDMLLKLLDVNLSEIKKRTIFNTVFSDLRKSHSWSVEGHFPRYSELLQLLKDTEYPIVNFSEVVSLSRRKINPEIEPTKKFNYIELANISSFGNVACTSEFFGHSAPSRAKRLLRKGDVLIPYLSACSENIGLVTEELDGFVGSTGFYIATSNKFDSWFLFALLKNPIFQNQLEQKVTGTIMSSIPSKLIRETHLPVIPKKKQIEVSDEIKLAFKLKKESLKLINEANYQIEVLMKKYQLEVEDS